MSAMVSRVSYVFDEDEHGVVCLVSTMAAVLTHGNWQRNIFRWVSEVLRRAY
jgi:hypothetical protein